MTDLISQLFDIATNEEFSADQRKALMAIALDDWHLKGVVVVSVEAKASDAVPPSLNIDAALGRHITKETLPNGGIRFGLASQLPAD